MQNHLVLLLLTLAFLPGLQCAALPVIPDPTIAIPGSPPLPPLPPGEGAGPYSSRKPGLKDFAIFGLCKTLVMGGAVTMKPHAAINLQRYLNNDGKERIVDPETIMIASPFVRGIIMADVMSRGKEELAQIKDMSGKRAFQLPWQVTGPEESSDFFFANGLFSYSVSGVVTKTDQQTAKLDYVVDVYDLYNWDSTPEKWIEIAGQTIYTKNLGSLHVAGLAKEYIIRGRSKTRTIDDLIRAQPPG